LAPDAALFLIPSSLRAGEIARVLREGDDVARLNDGFTDLQQVLCLDYLFIDTHPGGQRRDFAFDRRIGHAVDRFAD
jgi:hypothetical protein